MDQWTWNEETRQYEPFSPGERKYPSLPKSLRAELDRIVAVSDGMMDYRPCKVRLKNGEWQDFVYIVEATKYIEFWGCWPDQHTGKHEIKIKDVAAINKSPSRMPPKFARRLYEAGESGMGYVRFEICYNDGTCSSHFHGNLLDFMRLPKGKTPKDIVDVRPHAGRTSRAKPSYDYYWCLVGKL